MKLNEKSACTDILFGLLWHHLTLFGVEPISWWWWWVWALCLQHPEVNSRRPGRSELRLKASWKKIFTFLFFFLLKSPLHWLRIDPVGGEFVSLWLVARLLFCAFCARCCGICRSYPRARKSSNKKKRKSKAGEWLNTSVWHVDFCLFFCSAV